MWFLTFNDLLMKRELKILISPKVGFTIINDGIYFQTHSLKQEIMFWLKPLTMCKWKYCKFLKCVCGWSWSFAFLLLVIRNNRVWYWVILKNHLSEWNHRPIYWFFSLISAEIKWYYKCKQMVLSDFGGNFSTFIVKLIVYYFWFLWPMKDSWGGCPYNNNILSYRHWWIYAVTEDKNQWLF